MSTDAVAWAGAYPLPFKSARQRQRAKAVLKCLGQYAGVTGRSWVTMTVFLVETDLGHERTVQRGLEDLKACGAITDTGDWETYYGRRYKIYQLALDHGPRNTRERLQSALHDVDDGVTDVSPQAVWGDNSGASRGDQTVGLGVTAVSPKEEVNSQDKPSTCEREAIFDRLVSVCPRSMLRFVDLVAARREWEGICRTGQDLNAIVEGLVDGAQHPEFKSRKHPPQLHEWLGKGTWVGWLPQVQPELPLDAPGPAAGPAGAAPEPEQAIWRTACAAIRAGVGEQSFVSWFSRAFLGGVHPERLFVVAATGAAVTWITEHAWTRVGLAWAEADRLGRRLVLISKSEFEARLRRGDL